MKKILIVDDEKQIVTAYNEHLAREGYEIETAYDGEEALMKVKEFAPDLILLDILMPNLDGLEALKNLKEDALTKDIPVIMLTNLGEKENLVRASELGSTLYFIKAETSLAILDRWIKDILA